MSDTRNAVAGGQPPATVVLSLDFETRSACDLKTRGVYVYAADPSTDVWCLAWAFDDEEPAIWTPADGPLPQRIVDHFCAGGELRAWNAAFERLIWQHIMVPRYGAPVAQLEQWHDTAAEAAAMALPRALGSCAALLDVPQQKDTAGHNLMLRMSRPRRDRGDGTLWEWWDEPDKLAKLYAYCQQDVRTERAIYHRVQRLLPYERALYLLDQQVNDTGVQVDLPLVHACNAVLALANTEVNRRVAELTGGALADVTNHSALAAYLREQGLPATSVDKAAVREMLEHWQLTPDMRELLELRQTSAKSSTAKLVSMALHANRDGRARGLFLYHGASTGRWTGKGVQPHNFPRGEVKNAEAAIPAIHAGDMPLIAALGAPHVIVSSLLRGCLRAGEGYELVCADFSAIEARVLNWLAGQEDVLQLFRRYDAAAPNHKPAFDPYRHMAAKLYGIPLEAVEKFPHRQTGKFAELGCGYGMGAKKAVTAGKDTYQLDLSEDDAQRVVQLYRTTHPQVVQLWHDSERALFRAVRNPGLVVSWGPNDRLRAKLSGGFLWLRLPSGRRLCYPKAHIAAAPVPWDPDRRGVVYLGQTLGLQLGRVSLYGGKIAENIVQAVSRDLLAERMLAAQASGFRVVLHVHDEVVCEIPESMDGDALRAFEHLMSQTPAWADGCPVAAEGWRGTRYHK